MAFAQDLLTRIINIKRRLVGAVFVIGDATGIIWAVEIRNEDDAGNPLGEIGRIGPPHEKLEFTEEEPGVFQGGSFGLAGPDETPTFLLAGYHHTWSPEFFYHLDGVVMISNDGFGWTRAWDHSENNGSFQLPGRMIWDDVEKKFYMLVDCQTPYVPLVPPFRSTECWSSLDGINWEVVQSGVAPDMIPSVFTEHCPYKWQGSEDLAPNGSGIQNGNFGLDKSRKESTPPEEPTPPPAVGIILPEGHLITTEDFPSGAEVNFSQGVWGRLANDPAHGGLEVSLDHAQTWITVPGEVNRLRAFNGFVAGPIKKVT